MVKGVKKENEYRVNINATVTLVSLHCGQVILCGSSITDEPCKIKPSFILAYLMSYKFNFQTGFWNKDIEDGQCMVLYALLP
jgi:hypothetical protein